MKKVLVVAAVLLVGGLAGVGFWKFKPAAGGRGTSVKAYLDFQDMSSRDFYVRAFKPLRAKYGQEADFEVVPFPMPLHPRSKSASMAIRCAEEQGKTEAYIDALMEFIAFSESEISRAAKNANLDVQKFGSCLGKARRQRELEESIDEIRKGGVLSVPTVVAGGERITGQQPVEVYEQAVLKALGKPTKELKSYSVKIVHDPTCEVCEHSAYLRALKENFYPYLEGEEIECSSAEGKKILQDAKAQAVPFYVFDKGIQDITSFAQIRPILGEMEGGYYILPDAYRFTMRLMSKPNVTGTPEKGSERAKVRVVEFADFFCGHCAQFALNQLPILEEKFVKTGTVRWSMAIYPLAEDHVPAAQAAYCAEDQGKFWEYHDLLFKNARGRLGSEDFMKFAREVKLKEDAFKKCIENPAGRARVQKVTDAGRALGVNSTPTFFVEDLRIKGGQPVSAFEAAIQQKLKDKGNGNPCAL